MLYNHIKRVTGLRWLRKAQDRIKWREGREPMCSIVDVTGLIKKGKKEGITLNNIYYEF